MEGASKEMTTSIPQSYYCFNIFIIWGERTSKDLVIHKRENITHIVSSSPDEYFINFNSIL